MYFLQLPDVRLHTERFLHAEGGKISVTIDLNMYLTMAIGLLMSMLGGLLRKKIRFLETFCIPAPVIGGLIFAIVNCVLHGTGILSFDFDETIKDICMMAFFTTVGFQANLKALKTGEKALALLVILSTGLIVLQNLGAVGGSKLIGFDPLLGLCTGSIPMTGGHGTCAAFGPMIEEAGHAGATTFGTAAATFGLIMGSLMGGPLARQLITRYHLCDASEKAQAEQSRAEEIAAIDAGTFTKASMQIVLAMGIGSLISYLISLTGVTLPGYIGSMIVAAVMRNIAEYTGKIQLSMPAIDEIGGIALSLFLGIAMITLKLWQLAELALPLILLLVLQTAVMFLYARFVAFRVMGGDYDAAVITAGLCGFGMGATPNALANIRAVTKRYRPSPKADLVVPLTGGLFIDFINTGIITLFLNILLK